MKDITILILITLTITLGGCLTTIPVFAVTNKYIETGTFALATNPYTGNTSWNGYQQTTFDVLTARPHPGSYRKSIVFQQLDFLLTPSFEYNISIGVCTGSNSNKFVTCLSSTILSNLNTLRLRYLLIDSGFSKTSMFTLSAQEIGGSIVNIANPWVGTYRLPAMSTTGTRKAFLAWKGFNLSLPDSNLHLDLQLSWVYSSNTDLDVTISTSAPGNIIFHYGLLSLVSFHVEETADWPFPAAKLNYNTFAGANNVPAVYTDPNSLMQDYNTYWGLTRLYFQGQNSIHFNSFLTPPSKIEGTSSDPFKNLDFVVLIYQFKECDATTPYYMKSNDTCYDICPARYYGNAQFLCQSCVSYDCYQCTSTGTCTICSNSSDFRVLNTGTNRCDPMPGYYDDGTNSSLAKPCSASCKTCQTVSTDCRSCFDGKYYDGTSSCIPCMTNCLICSSGATCTTCNNSYIFDNVTGACVVNIDCSTIGNCTTCASTTGCTQCISGYNASNITTCSPVCGDGVKLPFEDCDDGNRVDGDGCSSNCTVQPAHYCSMNGLGSLCGNCSIHCTQCTDASTCQACASPYLLSNNTNSCLLDCTTITLCLTCHEPLGTNQTICDSCSLGYIPLNNTCVAKCGDSIIISPPQQCDDGNAVDGDGCSSACKFQVNSICNIVANKSVCSFCPGKKYADSSHATCVSCNYDCATCDSTGCLTCSSLAHRTLNTTTKKCDPNNGFYDDTTNELAPPCFVECLTCNGGNDSNCLSCNSNKGLASNGTCVLCSLTAGVGCSTCAYNSSLSAIECITCSSGNIQNGTCVPLLNIELPENPMPKLLLMILIPLLVALCCCGLIIYCIWKKRSHDENKVQEEQNQKSIENPQPQATKDPLNPQNPQKPERPKKIKHPKSIKSIQNGLMPYKVQSKKLEVKIEQNDTESNELSMNEFKAMNETNKQPQVLKERSQINDRSETSEQSDFSRPSQEEDEESRGCHY